MSQNQIVNHLRAIESQPWTQAGPGRAVKEQQEQSSPNHVQRIHLISVDHDFCNSIIEICEGHWLTESGG